MATKEEILDSIEGMTVLEFKELLDSNRGVLLVDNARAMVGDTIAVRAVLTDEQFEPLVVAEVNPAMPRTRGDSRIPVAEIRTLDRRMALVSQAIFMSVLAALLICAVVVLLFTTVFPWAEDALLVIEVAESSLAYDRSTKMRLYAEAGVDIIQVKDLLAVTLKPEVPRLNEACMHRADCHLMHPGAVHRRKTGARLHPRGF